MDASIDILLERQSYAENALINAHRELEECLSRQEIIMIGIREGDLIASSMTDSQTGLKEQEQQLKEEVQRYEDITKDLNRRMHDLLVKLSEPEVEKKVEEASQVVTANIINKEVLPTVQMEEVLQEPMASGVLHGKEDPETKQGEIPLSKTIGPLESFRVPETVHFYLEQIRTNVVLTLTTAHVHSSRFCKVLAGYASDGIGDVSVRAYLPVEDSKRFLEREETALKALKSVFGVPTYVSTVISQVGPNMIICEPALKKPSFISLKSSTMDEDIPSPWALIDLLDVLKAVHNAGFVHRDLCPRHVVRPASFSPNAPKFYLDGWGSAVPRKIVTKFEGSTAFCSDRVLALLRNEVYEFEYLPVDDLHAWTKMFAYCLELWLRKSKPAGKKRAADQHDPVSSRAALPFCEDDGADGVKDWASFFSRFPEYVPLLDAAWYLDHDKMKILAFQTFERVSPDMAYRYPKANIRLKPNWWKAAASAPA
ncbi:hypothetical protein HDU97_009500 [Phlyctochytrium planicorne]|nr:hypothetical protein HDU97_009500 [Phlyctochytrium planicorne]